MPPSARRWAPLRRGGQDIASPLSAQALAAIASRSGNRTDDEGPPGDDRAVAIGRSAPTRSSSLSRVPPSPWAGAAGDGVWVAQWSRNERRDRDSQAIIRQMSRWLRCWTTSSNEVLTSSSMLMTTPAPPRALHAASGRQWATLRCSMAAGWRAPPIRLKWRWCSACSVRTAAAEARWCVGMARRQAPARRRCCSRRVERPGGSAPVP